MKVFIHRYQNQGPSRVRVIVAIDLAHATDQLNDMLDAAGYGRSARPDDIKEVDMSKPSIEAVGWVNV